MINVFDEPGEALRQSNARVTHLLFDIRIYQRAEDLQNCARKGFRSQMRHPRDRGRGRAGVDLRGRLMTVLLERGGGFERVGSEMAGFGIESLVAGCGVRERREGFDLECAGQRAGLI